MISRWLGIRSVWLSLVLISASWSGLFWHQCHTSPTSSLLLVSECCSSLSAAEIRESTSPRTTCGSAFADAASVIGTTETTDEEVDASSVNGSTIRATPESTHSIHRLQQQQPSPSEKRRATMNQILLKAGRKGLGGGIPGAVAGIIQVVLLMWLRTVINYQSRYGTSFFKAVQILYREGGVGRFYRGVGFALFQAPLSRFVSTASNDGVLAFLASFPLTQNWGPGITTCFASIFVGTFRMILMPVDTCKTVLQVDSREGFRNLMRRVRAGKIGALYQGSLATAVSSVVGHYPWFYTFNTLSAARWLEKVVPSQLLRNASIGLFASIVSDTVVNVFRVIKTTKQSMGSKHDLSYSDTIRMIVAADGWKGLFGRGLKARIFANALQSIVFTVIWRGLAERWGNKDRSNNNGGSGSTTYPKPSEVEVKETEDHGGVGNPRILQIEHEKS